MSHSFWFFLSARSIWRATAGTTLLELILLLCSHLGRGPHIEIYARLVHELGTLAWLSADWNLWIPFVSLLSSTSVDKMRETAISYSLLNLAIRISKLLEFWISSVFSELFSSIPQLVQFLTMWTSHRLVCWTPPVRFSVMRCWQNSLSKLWAKWNKLTSSVWSKSSVPGIGSQLGTITS